MAKLIASQVKYARELYASKEHTVADIVALPGVGWQTIYRAHSSPLFIRLHIYRLVASAAEGCEISLPLRASRAARLTAALCSRR
jgi:hypothetical protein